MDWKTEAIEKLRNYGAMQESLRNIPAEIKRLEQEAKAIRGARTDGTPVKGGGSGREDFLLSNIVKREELKQALENAKAWTDTTYSALSTLERDERLILNHLLIYPEKNNVQKLAEALGVEQSSIYRRRDAALRHFTTRLYGIIEH